MHIIGIGHYSRVGKDTLASYLVQELERRGVSSRKASLAYKLKVVAHELYGWAGLREPEFYETDEGQQYRQVKLPELDLTPVEIWIKLGTDAVRDHVYVDTWVRLWLQTNYDEEVVIAPDMRTWNEASLFRKSRGWLVRLNRDGHSAISKLETGLDNWTDWDFDLQNSGLESLRQSAVMLADEYMRCREAIQQKTDRAVDGMQHQVCDADSLRCLPPGRIIPS